MLQLETFGCKTYKQILDVPNDLFMHPSFLMLENVGYGKDSIKLGFTKHMQCVHIYFANITMVSATIVQPSLNLEFLCTYKDSKMYLFDMKSNA